MRCHECGYMNEDDAKVCAKCGTKLSAESANQKQQAPAPPPPSKSSSEGAPTMRGKAASGPAWDEPSGPSGNAPSSGAPTSSANVNKCSSCGFYPLKEAPSNGNPCPNCGFEGSAASKPAASAERAEQAPSTASTMKLGDMNIGEKTAVIRLKDEGSGRTIEFSGNSIDLNRQNLEPSNNSLSGKTHAVLNYENGKVSLEDKSSNGATFVQVDKPLTLKSGTKIILGNKVYTVEFDK